MHQIDGALIAHPAKKVPQHPALRIPRRQMRCIAAHRIAIDDDALMIFTAPLPRVAGFETHGRRRLGHHKTLAPLIKRPAPNAKPGQHAESLEAAHEQRMHARLPCHHQH